MSVNIKQLLCPHCIHKVFLILICCDFIRLYCTKKTSFLILHIKRTPTDLYINRCCQIISLLLNPKSSPLNFS